MNAMNESVPHERAIALFLRLLMILCSHPTLPTASYGAHMNGFETIISSLPTALHRPLHRSIELLEAARN